MVPSCQCKRTRLRIRISQHFAKQKQSIFFDLVSSLKRFLKFKASALLTTQLLLKMFQSDLFTKLKSNKSRMPLSRSRFKTVRATQLMADPYGFGCTRLKSELVLRIHDILGWIWIWIQGSKPLTNGSGSCFFRHWPSRCQQKNKFKKKLICLLILEGTFTSFFKDKSRKESQKQ